MFARVTKYKMKADATDAATALMHQLKGDILALPGMHRFINVMAPDGSGYVISVVESQETSDANADAVRALWGRFADHLEAIPTPEGYDVVADWSA